MLKYAAISRKVTIFGISFILITIAFLSIPVMFGVIPRIITNLTDTSGKLLSLQSVYFYDVSINSYYYPTMMSQAFVCLLCGIAHTGIDVICGMAVLHACGQTEILANRIQIMVDMDSQNFKTLFKMHIENHVRLIRY